MLGEEISSNVLDSMFQGKGSIFNFVYIIFFVITKVPTIELRVSLGPKSLLGKLSNKRSALLFLPKMTKMFAKGRFVIIRGFFR